MTGNRDVEIGYVQTGHLKLFEDFADDGPMWAGDGEREVRQTVIFERQYFELPVVLLSVVLMDARTDFMIRYSIEAQSISTDGFDAVFRTWSDSKYARINLQWVAIGAATRDDYWVEY